MRWLPLILLLLGLATIGAGGYLVYISGKMCKTQAELTKATTR